MSDKIEEIQDPLSQGEEANLVLCNLVSRGMSISEAKAFIAENSDAAKGEAIEEREAPTNTLGLPFGHPETLEGLKNALEAAGEPQHPRQKLERTLASYRAKFLAGSPDGEREEEQP